MRVQLTLLTAALSIGLVCPHLANCQTGSFQLPGGQSVGGKTAVGDTQSSEIPMPPQGTPSSNSVFFAGGVFFFTIPPGARYKEEIDIMWTPNMFGPMYSTTVKKHRIVLPGGDELRVSSEVWTCPPQLMPKMGVKLMEDYKTGETRKTKASQSKIGVIFVTIDKYSCGAGLICAIPYQTPWGRYWVFGRAVLSFDRAKVKTLLPQAMDILMSTRYFIKRIPPPRLLLGYFDCGGVSVSSSGDNQQFLAASSKSIAFVSQDTAILGSYSAVGWYAGALGGQHDGERSVRLHYQTLWIPQTALRDVAVLFFGDTALKADAYSFTEEGSLVRFNNAGACSRAR